MRLNRLIGGRTVAAVVAVAFGVLVWSVGRRGRAVARRQRLPLAFPIHAARCRRRERHLQEARARRRNLGLRRRRQAAAGFCRGRGRSRYRLGTGHGVHRQRLADFGCGGRGRPAARHHALRAGQRPASFDRRSQGQARQYFERRIADRLDGARDRAPRGLGTRRHQDRRTRRRDGAALRSAHASDRYGALRHHHRLSARCDGRGSHPLEVRRYREGIRQSRDLSRRTTRWPNVPTT